MYKNPFIGLYDEKDIERIKNQEFYCYRTNDPISKVKNKEEKRCMECIDGTCNVTHLTDKCQYTTESKTTIGREIIYQSFCSYIGNHEFVKYKNFSLSAKDVYGVYVKKIISNTSVDSRYIFLIVKNDNVPVGFKAHLRDLRWESLQAKTINDIKQLFNIGSSDLTRRSDDIITSEIKLVDEKSDKITYVSSAYPLKIEIFPQKSYVYAYPKTSDIKSALESFKTTFSFTD